MKINKIKINSYGNLNNKEIELSDGINIIYGENEAGKSTLLNFIVNMLYGASKNKKGKEISDYEKYKPWNTEEFSGKLTYTLDNNEEYEIFREFGKKNPKLYNKNLEDITKTYSIDKNTGSQFFMEQTKIDEQTFKSTVVSYQNEIEIDNQTQNVLLQKIANVSSTGEDNISYKKAIEKLNKKQLEEIGTTRSQGKPINIVINEMQNLKNINENLKQYENYKYEIEDKKYLLQDEINKLNLQNEIMKKLNSVYQEEKVEKEKLKYNENKIDELEEKIQNLLSQKENVKKDITSPLKNDEKKLNKKPYVLGIIALLIIAVLAGIFVNYIVAIIPIIISVVIALIATNKNSKLKKQNSNQNTEYNKLLEQKKQQEKNIYEINAQIEILEKSKQDQVNEAERIKNDLNKNINNKKELLKTEYYGKIDTYEMGKIFSSSNSSTEIEKIQSQINEKNMELHKLELDKQNILPKLEQLAENEEKLAQNSEIYEDLVEKNNAINLAKEIIEHSYQEMKSNVTPQFTQNLSKNLAQITNNKYQKVVINEEEGILIELPNGEYINANRLSIGTIQALYLSFRLSIINDITEENMPIILDEIFAYCDEKRLKEIMKNITTNYSKHQIILLTCTHREEMALDEIGKEYKKVLAFS